MSSSQFDDDCYEGAPFAELWRKLHASLAGGGFSRERPYLWIRRPDAANVQVIRAQMKPGDRDGIWGGTRLRLGRWDIARVRGLITGEPEWQIPRPCFEVSSFDVIPKPLPGCVALGVSSPALLATTLEDGLRWFEEHRSLRSYMALMPGPEVVLAGPWLHLTAAVGWWLLEDAEAMEASLRGGAKAEREIGYAWYEGGKVASAREFAVALRKVKRSDLDL